MKIAALAVVSTAFLHLKGADGALLYDPETKEPVGIDVFGPGSPEASQVDDRQAARINKRMADNENKVTVQASIERRRDDADDMAILTAAFRHIEHDDPNGQPLTGKALFAAVYAEPTLGFIKEQFVKFQRDWGKFKPA